MDIFRNVSAQLSSQGNSILSSSSAKTQLEKLDTPMVFMSVYENATVDKATTKDLDQRVASILYTINYGVIISCICIVGIVGNIINVIIFAKQGTQETVNVTLLALAISDMASLATLFYLAISFNPLFEQAELDFYPMEVQVLFGGWPHVLFLRITAWLTAFISLERCFCVIFPLKVKTFFTLFRIKVIIVTIYVLVTVSMAPTYYYTRLGWRFDPQKNRSMLGLMYTHDRVQVEGVSYVINSVLSPVGYFAIILVSTAILVVNLNRKTKWRQQASGKTDDDESNFTNRDKRVVKMVVTIATIFIIFLVPSNVVFVWQTIEPELSIVGKYQNMFKVAVSFTLMLEAFNSSVNTIVYYNMSSNYKLVFRTLILRRK